MSIQAYAIIIALKFSSEIARRHISHQAAKICSLKHAHEINSVSVVVDVVSIPICSAVPECVPVQQVQNRREQCRQQTKDQEEQGREAPLVSVGGLADAVLFQIRRVQGHIAVCQVAQCWRRDGTDIIVRTLGNICLELGDDVERWSRKRPGLAV